MAGYSLGLQLLGPLIACSLVMLLFSPGTDAQLAQIAAAKDLYTHEIVVMERDGGNRTVVAGGNYRVEDPVWSPTSQTIAFASRESGSWDIWLVEADGTNRRKLTGADFTNEFSPAWYSDGKRLAYCSMASSLKSAQIHVVGLDGVAAPVATIPAPSIDPNLSPVSDTLVVTTPIHPESAGYDFGLAIWRGDGTALQRRVKEDLLLSQAHWSPDGSRLVLRGNKLGFGDIYVLNMRSLTFVQVTDHPSEDAYPTWEPNGDRIIFSSDRSGDFDLYSVNADGSELTNLTNTPNTDELHPALSPDGRRIAFVSIRSRQKSVPNADGQVLRRGALPPSLQTGKYVEDSWRDLSPWRLGLAWRRDHALGLMLLGAHGELIGGTDVHSDGDVLYFVRDDDGFSLMFGGPTWYGTYARIRPNGTIVRESHQQRDGMPAPTGAEYVSWPYRDSDGTPTTVPPNEIILPKQEAESIDTRKPQGTVAWLIELADGRLFVPRQALPASPNAIWVVRAPDGRLTLSQVESSGSKTRAEVDANRAVLVSDTGAERKIGRWAFQTPEGQPAIPPEGFTISLIAPDDIGAVTVHPGGGISFPSLRTP